MPKQDNTILPRRAERIGSLDFLRGIAILLVLCHHQPLWAPLQRFGWTGVDLFFVLSGFLVSGLLFAEYRRSGTIRPVRFLVRRGFKIYPGYYALILATVAVSLASTVLKQDGSSFLDVKALLAESLFLQNYLGGIYVHTWSLAVEEHFYIAITLVLLLTMRLGLLSRPRLFTAALIGSLALCLVLRGAHFALEPYDYETHFVPTHLRFDGLVFGVLLAYWHHFHRDVLTAGIRKMSPWLWPLAALALLPAFFADPSEPFMYTLGFSLLYIGFGIVLLGALLEPGVEQLIKKIAGRKIYRFVCTIGIHSYAIYLWHMFVIKYAMGFFDHRGMLDIDFRLRFLLYAAASIGLGILMTRLLELPMLRLRNRLFPSPVSAAGSMHAKDTNDTMLLYGRNILRPYKKTQHIT